MGIGPWLETIHDAAVAARIVYCMEMARTMSRTTKTMSGMPKETRVWLWMVQQQHVPDR